MRRTKFYSYILAALLNAAPFFRSISTSSALLSTPFAIVMRWAFGAAAVAGSFHGASAASTVTITPTSATGTNGVSMAVRFVVKYSVTEGGHTTTLIAQSYRASGLPPGLSMTAQGLTGGTVTGKPASSGQFTATIIGYQSPNFQDNQSPPMPVVFNIISSSSPPTVTVSPTNSTVSAGSRLVLTATPGGDGPFIFQWLLGDLEVNNATNSTLVFDPIQLSDAGSYRVRVSNSGGTVFSGLASVQVTSAAPVISSPPQSKALHLGESAQLTVGVSGNGPFAYQWTSNHVSMPGGTNTSLTIADAQPADAATYTVKVTNSGGTTESAPATITVGGPLELLSPSVNGSGNFLAQFVGLSGRIYTVESVNALGGEWSPVGPNVNGSGGTNTVTDPTAASPHRFYRVQTAN